MFIAYVDESGDAGHNVAITSYFTLSGIILADSNWKIFLEKVKAFRQGLKRDFGLTSKADLRATDLWRSGGDFRELKLPYANQVEIFERTAELLRSSQEIVILNVSINKGSPNLPSTAKVSEIAWTMFLQRYENWLIKRKQELGIVINDEGYDKMLRLLSRKMRVYNPIPSHFGSYRNIPVVKIIEDPFPRHSQDSYFVQLADMSAYLARLRHDHTPSQAKAGLHKLYKRIKPRYMLEASKKIVMGLLFTHKKKPSCERAEGAAYVSLKLISTAVYSLADVEAFVNTPCHCPNFRNYLFLPQKAWHVESIAIITSGENISSKSP